HPTFLEWRAGPSLVTGLARAGNHLIPPELAAGFGVVAGDITAVRRILARAACNDHAIRHNRAGGVADVQFTTAIGLPDDLAGAGPQRYDEIVPRYEIDLIATERNAALTLSKAITERPGWRERMPVLPHEISGRGIDRLNHVAGITHIHHAVVD